MRSAQSNNETYFDETVNRFVMIVCIITQLEGHGSDYLHCWWSQMLLVNQTAIK